MLGKGLWITLRLLKVRSSIKCAKYLKEIGVFLSIGDGCSILKRQLPLYPNLIKFGNNVHVASNAGFVVHDITHMMFNRSDAAKSLGGTRLREKVGSIEI